MFTRRSFTKMLTGIPLLGVFAKVSGSEAANYEEIDVIENKINMPGTAGYVPLKISELPLFGQYLKELNIDAYNFYEEHKKGSFRHDIDIVEYKNTRQAYYLRRIEAVNTHGDFQTYWIKRTAYEYNILFTNGLIKGHSEPVFYYQHQTDNLNKLPQYVICMYLYVNKDVPNEYLQNVINSDPWGRYHTINKTLKEEPNFINFGEM